MKNQLSEETQRIIETIEKYAETEFKGLHLLTREDLLKIQHLAIEAKAFDNQIEEALETPVHGKPSDRCMGPSGFYGEY